MCTRSLSTGVASGVPGTSMASGRVEGLFWDMEMRESLSLRKLAGL